MAEILRNHGYNVQRTHGSNDGVDIYAKRVEAIGIEGLCSFQCKRQHLRSKVDLPAVSELYGIVCARNATGGLVVTTSFFTSPAKEFQTSVANRIALMDNDDVLQWLRETTPRVGPVEHRVPQTYPTSHAREDWFEEVRAVGQRQAEAEPIGQPTEEDFYKWVGSLIDRFQHSLEHRTCGGHFGTTSLPCHVMKRLSRLLQVASGRLFAKKPMLTLTRKQISVAGQ